MTFNSSKLFFPLILSILFLTACDNSAPDASGSLQFDITDAPIDNAEVKAVFVTVADVQIDGESYAEFEGKQTIEISALQNGKTEALGLASLEAGSYNSIELILDYESDEDGNSPGCYVERQDGQKDDLAADGQTSGTFTLTKDFEIAAESTTSLVIDMDLRKAIKEEPASSYEFVSQSELSSSFRIVEAEASGEVDGTISTSAINADATVIVYAYQKGEFDQDRESSPNSDGLRFEQAVTSSAAVKSGNSWEYSLHFMEEGEYEVCYAVYEDDDQDGRSTFSGFLQTSIGLNPSVTADVSIEANLASVLEVSILGFLRL